MSDEPIETLPTVVETAISQLPEGWKSRLTKFLLKTLGVATVPQFAYKVGDQLDTLAGRQFVAMEMAKAVSQRLAADPAQVDRAMVRFWGAEAERQHNLESIAAQAVEEIAKHSPDEKECDEISEDWRRKFTSFAGDVSEPEMQSVWARVLAGEFTRPGSFSYRTLRTISEMQTEIAQIFAEIAQYKFGPDALFVNPEEWSAGVNYSKMKKLLDWDLIVEMPATSTRSFSKDERGRYFFWGVKNAMMIFKPDAPDVTKLPITLLSQAGREISSLLDENHERSTLNSMAEFLRRTLEDPEGVAVIGKRIDSAIVEPQFIWGTIEKLQAIPPAP